LANETKSISEMSDTSCHTHTQQLHKISEAITDNNINITTIMMKVNVFDCGNIIVVEPPGKTSRVGTRGVHRPGGPRAGPENKFI